MKVKQWYMRLVMLVKGHLNSETVVSVYSIEELLSECSKDEMRLNEEDRKWLHDKAIGKEVLWFTN